MTTEERTGTAAVQAGAPTVSHVIEGLEKTVDELDSRVARFADALQHIARVCEGSRQRTRRIRWIEARAQCTLNGNEAWKTLDIPKHEPGMRRLSEIIASVYDIVKREVEALRDVYEDKATGAITDEQAAKDVKVLDKFLRDAYHEVESIRHYEQERRAAADGR